MGEIRHPMKFFILILLHAILATSLPRVSKEESSEFLNGNAELEREKRQAQVASAVMIGAGLVRAYGMNKGVHWLCETMKETTRSNSCREECCGETCDYEEIDEC